MILRTQFKGIGAFCKRKRLAGEVGGGGLIVHQAKRLPLLKFPRKKNKKNCMLACNLHSVRIVHYQIIDVHK